MAEGLLGLGILPERAELIRRARGLFDLLPMAAQGEPELLLSNIQDSIGSNVSSELMRYIDSEFPPSQYPSARPAMMATIVSEAGEDMRYDQEQKKRGPGYGLFQMERPHFRRRVGNKIYSRLNATEAEKKRGFKPYLNTLGARYNKFLKDNDLKDSAKAQITFMSNIIKRNKNVLDSFKSSDRSKAIDSFTAKIIKPRGYLNKQTRQAELRKRRRAAERF